MFEDGDRLLDLIGVVLVVAVAAGVGVVALNVGSAEESTRPEADWTVERVNDTHVKVVHAGGDPLPAERLLVTTDGVPRSADWPDPVTEDDAATVRAREGTVVKLFWDGGRTRQTLVDSWTV
jgi:FlaG/FlaF family flagellin (archaellin)